MAPPRRKWDRMSRETYLRTELRQAHEDLAGARSAESWQAVSSLRLRTMDIRRELDEVLASAAKTNALEEMSDEELIDAILSDLEAMPESLVERLLHAMQARLQ